MNAWKVSALCISGGLLVGVTAGQFVVKPQLENLRETTASLSTQHRSIDHDLLLNSIGLVESNNNANAVGRDGERGIYQIMESTWDEHSSYSFDFAFDPVISRQVAMNYLGWIEQTLIHWGINRDPTIEDLAACYNGGIGRFRNRGFIVENMPTVTRNYVKKVSDAYNREGR
jgi:soluble lytic murein transglycosylase-like protein